MSTQDLALTLVIAAASIVLGSVVIHLTWQAVGAWRINRAGPRHLTSTRHVLWRDPGPVETLDMSGGPGGKDFVPTPPFHFLEEHDGGSQPCVSVRDARGRRWRVKWGDEVRSENFAIRLAWACGYFAETTYFVSEGMIEGAKDLKRARECIHDDCRFEEARFELDDPAVRKLFEEHGWAWNDNPFVGTRELHGLKILVMLLSNWDTKDRRDVARGSNTAIFEVPSRWGHEARYLITDWGGSMGKWGGFISREKWDCNGFRSQTKDFVKGVRGDQVEFGYSGQHSTSFKEGIRASDVQWVTQYLTRITDEEYSLNYRI